MGKVETSMKLLKQKLFGLLLIALTILIIRFLGIQETGLYNGNIAFITIPIALYLIFTKKYITW